MKPSRIDITYTFAFPQLGMAYMPVTFAYLSGPVSQFTFLLKNGAIAGMT
jgi:hypothetical protein